MQVIRAKVCGFCYGVKRAVEMAQQAGKDYAKASTLGEIVHNPDVVANLARQGVGVKTDLKAFSPGEAVVIRSHGVGPAVYAEAQSLGLPIVDATCPNVRAVQLAAERFAKEGRQVVVIGEAQHPEVRSILAWAGEGAVVVEHEADIEAVPEAESYGIVSQTTLDKDIFARLVGLIKAKFPAKKLLERTTICLATSERQKSARELAQRADCVIVIGGKNSANTRHLTEIIANLGKKVYQIEKISEISASMLKNCGIIGITAGASTPEEIIKEAISSMENETMDSMENLLSKECVKLHIGMIADAKVVHVTDEEVVVDFGYQSEGAVAFDQWVEGGTRETVAPTVHEGDIVTLKVLDKENQDGLVVMSKVKAEAEKAWLEVPAMVEAGEPIEVTALKAVKGGVTASVNGLEGVTGFIPASHLELKRVEDLSSYEGQVMKVKVLEFDPKPNRKRLVLSRREVLREERSAANKAYREERAARIAKRKEEEAESLANVEEGTTVRGVVKSIVEFGMFVEIAPSLQGLVHISELSWERGVKPADLYKVGDEVDVYIKGVDAEARRVSLSVKALLPDPWETAVSEYQEGDVVTGTVVRFLSFGAIVRISDMVEGMVHISEIANHRVEKPDDELELGQEVNVKVLHIDLENKKVALSIKRA